MRAGLPPNTQLEAIERNVPAGKLIHAVLDNYATHKHPKVRAWLERHPRWVFHFTPTSASWLNAVEGFFSTLACRRLKRGVFKGVVDLQAAINRYLNEHNADPEPFVWTKPTAEILNKLANLPEPSVWLSAPGVVGAIIPCNGPKAGGAPSARGGFYVEPTVFSDTSPAMKIVREEVFGPVGVLIPFKDDADAIRIANDTSYGLAAGLWTRDISRAHTVARALQAGTVWVNTSMEIDIMTPFGGYKPSGVGRELDEEAIETHTQVKSIVVRFWLLGGGNRSASVALASRSYSASLSR